MKNYFKLSISYLFLVCSLYGFDILDNENMVFGSATPGTPTYHASENSVNTSGTLQQPFYWDATYSSGSGAWQKLTYSHYPLDNIIAVGGDGTNDWNTNGVTVINPDLANQVIDISGFTKYDTDRGTGTIVSTGIVTVDGYELEITNSYELPAGKSYIVMTTKVKNVDIDGRTVTNLRFWTGTQDDYIGANDSNSKSRGNFIDGAYTEVTAATEQARVVKIFNGTAGIYFYSISPKADSIIATRYGFSTLLATAPSDQISISTDDGSYAIYMRLNDLAIGESEEFTVYYAAGPIDQLDAIALDVSNAASVGKIVDEDNTVIFGADDFRDSNDVIYSKIKITALSANGILYLNGVAVTVGQEISSSDYVNMTYVPNPNYAGDDSFTWQGYIEVNATSTTFSSLQHFNLVVTGVNDTPTIDTTFVDLTIQEDALSFSVDVNVSDIDGDDLNLTVESNNTALLVVTQNYTNLLRQGEYSGLTLDFNLTTQENANGIASITVTVNDGVAQTTKTVDVNVTAVNDALILGVVSDIIVYKNSGESKNVLSITDIDSNYFTYLYSYDTSLIGITTDNNTMNITPIIDMIGATDVNVTVNDGEFNSSKIFKFTILPLEDGDDVEEVGNIYVNEINTTRTITLVINTNLTIVTQKDDNGSVAHIIEIGDVNTTASSDLDGSTVSFTPEGVSTTYSDVNVFLEVNAMVTGEATYEFSVGGETTTARSEFVGAQTELTTDANGYIEITTAVVTDANTSVSVIAHADGTAEHRVSVNGVVSQVASDVSGANTIISTNGGVETTAGRVADGNGRSTRAMAVTAADGRTITRFISVSQEDASDIKVLENTYRVTTPYAAGNEVKIGVIGTTLYIKTMSARGVARLIVE